jgi:hypothetical protein
MAKYDLYSYIDADPNEFSKDLVRGFVDRVKRISQIAVPVGDTGRLKAGWFEEVQIDTDNRIKIKFGYKALNEEGKNYAMPVDYYTGGMVQTGFFSGAVKLSYISNRSKKMGQIQDTSTRVRGVTEEQITLPGESG